MADSMFVRDGAIYFAASGVTPGSTELGKFEGAFTINQTYTRINSFQQHLVAGESIVVSEEHSVTVAGYDFSYSAYLEFLGISSSAGTMVGTATTALVYEFTDTSTDVDLTKELLFQGTFADTGKALQYKLFATPPQGIPGLPIGANALSRMDVTFPALRDGSGNVATLYIENT